MYHKVDLRSPTMWWVDAATFYCQMSALRAFRVVYLDEYDPADPTQVVITFDGVYKNVLRFAAPILKKFGYPFELFVSSDFIGKCNDFDAIEPAEQFASREELARLLEHGGRLQWHTRSHPKLEQGRRDSDWSDVELELSVPADIIDMDPAGFRWFAYPHGVFSRDVYNEVRKRFVGAVSCHQGNDVDLHCLNRMTVTNSTRIGRTTVCVVVVSRNYGAFLSEAIESVLQQTCPPDSVLIMDDASTDSTQSIGKAYCSLHPGRLFYLRNEQHLGIVETFNRAVRETSSDYICFLGADNRISSNYIECCKAVLDFGGSEIAIAYTDFLLFGAKAQDEYFKHDARRRGRIIDNLYYEVVFPEFTKRAFLEGSFIHGSAMYRRAAFDDVGGYQAQHEGRPEDANLFRRMVRAGYGARKVGRTWLEYRQHSEAQANVISRTQGELHFYRVYSKRLEMKVKALEVAFGVLSPVVKLASTAEKICFESLVRVARYWRRIF